jgi:hypothetical protein
VLRVFAKGKLDGGLVEGGIAHDPQVLVVFLALIETLLELPCGLTTTTTTRGGGEQLKDGTTTRQQISPTNQIFGGGQTWRTVGKMYGLLLSSR